MAVQVITVDRDGISLISSQPQKWELVWDSFRTKFFLGMKDSKETMISFPYHPSIEDLINPLAQASVYRISALDIINWAREKGLEVSGKVFQIRYEKIIFSSRLPKLRMDDLLSIPQIPQRGRDDFNRIVDGISLEEMSKEKLENLAVCVDFYLARKS